MPRRGNLSPSPDNPAQAWRVTVRAIKVGACSHFLRDCEAIGFFRRRSVESGSLTFNAWWPAQLEGSPHATLCTDNYSCPSGRPGVGGRRVSPAQSPPVSRRSLLGDCRTGRHLCDAEASEVARPKPCPGCGSDALRAGYTRMFFEIRDSHPFSGNRVTVTD